MNHSSGIYCIENTKNGKKYIGQTTDLQRRKLSHLSALRNGKSHNPHLQASFNKYGESSFIFYVIEECDVNVLDPREQFWIASLKTYEYGYNLDLGGGGIRGYHFTDEQKAKISNALRGHTVSEEAKRRMSENHADVSGEKNPWYGIPWAERLSVSAQESVRYKMSQRNTGANNPNWGKRMSDEQRFKLSCSHKRYFETHESPLKGRKRPEYSGEKHYKAHSIVCLNTGEYFKTIKDATQKYGISQSSISNCCSYKSQYGGKNNDGIPLVWMTADDYYKLSDEDIQKRLHLGQFGKRCLPSKKVLCSTTGEIFDSMKSACDRYGIDPSMLSAHCRRRRCLNGCGRHPETGELLKWEYV